MSDSFSAARAVADAVLYEGYVLYPYRASSRKNQVRWQFGVLVPEAYAAVDPSERWSAQTECIWSSAATDLLMIRIRCLQLQHKSVERAGPGGFAPVDQLAAGGSVHVDWDEAVDQVIELPVVAAGTGELTHHFQIPGGFSVEELADEEGRTVGRLVRTRCELSGVATVEIDATHVESPSRQGLRRVRISVSNTAAWVPDGSSGREGALPKSLLALHVMMGVDGGRFVSLLDPPPSAAGAVRSCHQDGLHPVLIGDDDIVVLSAPIILYDHPEVAPESQGDMFDATEIDEILALRVLTLTDAEKAEARGTDARSAALIDRCDSMPPDAWERLHGTMRSVRSLRSDAPDLADLPVIGDPTHLSAPSDGEAPWWDPGSDSSVDPGSDSLWVGDAEVRRGTPVRLHPGRRSDAHDIFLAGMSATVAGVFKDVDGNDYIAVTVDDDPATVELAWQGRYLYFYPDEIELREGSVGGP